MLRFCDREVDCIEYCSLSGRDALNRANLLLYFLEDHKDAVVCVYDDFNSMEFMGIITYQSLNSSLSFRGSIQMECLILDEDIWENAHLYSAKHAERDDQNFLIPVIDQNGELICFAYEDSDANRELRQLRELSELPEAMQFSDIYPEYKCVIIHEYNELAFFFAEYLRHQNIMVQFEGMMCGDGGREECQVPNYECLHIYAEGTWQKKRNWKENLLRSVSVEFECVDKIYESNILSGNIEDGGGDWSWFIEKIGEEKEIVLIGTGIDSINAYDLLVANGIDILCFMSNNQRSGEYRLFGKKILSEIEIKSKTKRPIFIECDAKNSAWGFGKVDKYDYEGYRRNQQYFLLKDYTDIPIGSLKNVLKGKNVILLGNLNLCYNVGRLVKAAEKCNITYWDILDEHFENEIRLPRTNIETIGENDICILVEPQYISYDKKQQRAITEKKELYWYKIKEKNINNITDYFSKREVLISIQKNDTKKYTLSSLTPGAILLNISGHMSGNVFFKFILDGHPDIMTICDRVIINNLFFICMQLAEEKSEDILNTFWIIFDTIYAKEMLVKNRKIFEEKFRAWLAYKNTFTSQELFVIFHAVYREMCGGQIPDLRNMLIYYEDREEVSHVNRMNYEKWLNDEEVRGFSIDISRNAYVRMGSFLKHLDLTVGITYSSLRSTWDYMTYERKGENSPAHWRRIGVKFETLKTAPKETLLRLCNVLGIAWDDCLLETTRQGKTAEYPDRNGTIIGFDLKPVYNLYEEYFSDFDRFRINMIFSVVQSKFGYPCVSCLNFSDRQLQEMFLKKFRFESGMPDSEGQEGMKNRADFINKAYEYLRKAYREEIMQKNEDDSLYEDMNML